MTILLAREEEQTKQRRPRGPSVEDGAASNCMVNKANKGAKETTDERRSNVVW